MVRTIRSFNRDIQKLNTESHQIHFLYSNFLPWLCEALFTQNILRLRLSHSLPLCLSPLAMSLRK